MKIKLGEIVEAKPHLEILIKKDISWRASYRISKLIEELNKELIKFEKTRTKIFEKYGEEFEADGQKQIRVKAENSQNFSMAMDSVLDENVTIQYEPMVIDDLIFYEEGVPKEGSIPVENMLILSKFFKEKETKKDETV